MKKRRRSAAAEAPVSGIGFLRHLRDIEQHAREDQPRIGTNFALSEELVALGQDPFMGFPTDDFTRRGTHPRGVPELRTNILGFFGPHGALPLDITEEVYRWTRSGDQAFVHFTDIFSTRFQQLFYRVWADARAITQFDHPIEDRFRNYLGALLGIGTPAFQKRDILDDYARLALAPLALGRIKSPRKLQQMLEQDLQVELWIEEHVPVWIAFEDDARNALGRSGATLGRDIYLGARVQSVDEKIVIHIHTETLAQYRGLLPGGTAHERLQSIVRWYLGEALDVAVSLTLPAREVVGAVIGKSAELGWMAVLEPRDKRPPESPVQGATYALTRTV